MKPFREFIDEASERRVLVERGGVWHHPDTDEPLFTSREQTFRAPRSDEKEYVLHWHPYQQELHGFHPEAYVWNHTGLDPRIWERYQIAHHGYTAYAKAMREKKVNEAQSHSPDADVDFRREGDTLYHQRTNEPVFQVRNGEAPHKTRLSVFYRPGNAKIQTLHWHPYQQELHGFDNQPISNPDSASYSPWRNHWTDLDITDQTPWYYQHMMRAKKVNENVYVNNKFLIDMDEGEARLHDTQEPVFRIHKLKSGLHQVYWHDYQREADPGLSDKPVPIGGREEWTEPDLVYELHKAYNAKMRNRG